MEPRGSIAIEKAFEDGLRTGDQFTLTSGRECYPMGNGGLLEVGPIQATVTVAKNEKPQDAYLRARVLVEALFEAEYELKRGEYARRMKELHG